MYRQIIIPTSKNYILRLPDELIGQKVEVIAFAIEQHTESAADEKELGNVEQFYKSHKIDMSNFAFNRDELHER